MKRLLALLLTAGLTIGLTGCGPEQGEHSSQESSGAESSSPELSLPEQSYESVEEVPDFYVQVLIDVYKRQDRRHLHSGGDALPHGDL